MFLFFAQESRRLRRRFFLFFCLSEQKGISPVFLIICRLVVPIDI